MQNNNQEINIAADSYQLAFVLDVLAVMREQDSFDKACAALCDHFKKEFSCTLVSMGWLKGGYVRLKAVSSKQDFEENMEISQALQHAMDEAVVSGEEITVSPDNRSLPPNHKLIKGMTSCLYSKTLPFGDKNSMLGALILQKESEAFTEKQIITARIALENTAYLLQDLFYKNQGFLHALLRGSSKRLDDLFRVKNASRIAWALFFSALFMVFLFMKIDYRLSCAFIIKSDKQAVVSAATSGYLKSIVKKKGDQVEKEELLVELDSSDLLVKKYELAAELERYRDQERIFRKENRFSDMKLASSSAEYTKARIKSLDHQISKAMVRSPIKGCIIEDRDLSQKINMPVKSGDELMIIADLQNLFVQIALPEESRSFFRKKMPGGLKFLSSPEKEFSLDIESISPSAVSRRGKNVFLVRAALKDQIPWCRPGMTGQCYLNAGKQTLAWIVFYRIADWFRLNLWW